MKALSSELLGPLMTGLRAAMKDESNDAERRVAVACMRHLLTETAAKMPSGKEWSAKLLI